MIDKFDSMENSQNGVSITVSLPIEKFKLKQKLIV